jgi:glycosyltransferase involved in cell wall biosynthesis
LTSTCSDAPRVSVIVPVYNRRIFLERCLASIEATRYPNLELLLIDDGSSDGSWALMQQWAHDRGDRIRALHHPHHQNRGISASRNLGILQATGKYVAFLDSDDEYYPHRFAACVGLLEADPDQHAIYERALIESDGGGGEGCLVPGTATLQAIGADPLGWLFRNDWWHTSAITLRRDFLIRFGLFRPDLRVGEDTELWMRLAATGRIRSSHQGDPVALVHRHGSGHSWDDISTSRQARIYRKTLMSALRAINQRPYLYHPSARARFQSRHFKAVEDELDQLSQRGDIPGLLRLGLEAGLRRPGALLSRRSLGNLLGWRKWKR